MRYEFLLSGHVLPVVRMSRLASDQAKPIRVAGTGFTFGEGTLLTCWHCVREPVTADEFYATVSRSEGVATQSYDQWHEIDDLGPDANGADLALGRVVPIADRLILGNGPVDWGSDIVSIGYPLPLEMIDLHGGPSIEMNSRLLRGYVTRVIPYATGGARVIELDMPAPPGLSGAPVFRVKPFEVIGVITGVAETSHGEAGTFAFAIALHPDVLRAARGSATDDKPLLDHLNRTA